MLRSGGGMLLRPADVPDLSVVIPTPGRMPDGDQGLVLRREADHRVGGYPSVPLMEDVMIVRRLRRTTGIRIPSVAAQVSGRRWQANGPLRRMLGNWPLMVRVILGETPASLDGQYPPSGTVRKPGRNGNLRAASSIRFWTPHTTTLRREGIARRH